MSTHWKTNFNMQHLQTNIFLSQKKPHIFLNIKVLNSENTTTKNK